MYQYKAILKSNRQIIAQDHSVEGVENKILNFRRKAKKGLHTRENEPVEIYHVFRDGKKQKLIKIV